MGACGLTQAVPDWAWLSEHRLALEHLHVHCPSRAPKGLLLWCWPLRGELVTLGHRGAQAGGRGGQAQRGKHRSFVPTAEIPASPSWESLGTCHQVSPGGAGHGGRKAGSSSLGPPGRRPHHSPTGVGALEEGGHAWTV